MSSFQSKALVLLLRVMRIKERLGHTRERAESGQITRARPSRQMDRRYHITTRVMHERTVYILAPRERTSSKHIYYLHGGSYINGFASQHWRFLGRLVDALGCTITAPDYPLAPTSRADDVFAMVLPLYQDVVESRGAANVTLMGDSAGGGMALALAQQLCEAGLPQPANIVLLSPWLDVTMSNPDIQAVDLVDPVLNIQGLRDAGKLYAQERDRTSPLISPVYGSLAHLGPITLFIGTHDILWPDARKLKAQAEAEGIEIAYYEYQDMAHLWMLLGSLPEAKQVMRQLVATLTA